MYLIFILLWIYMQFFGGTGRDYIFEIIIFPYFNDFFKPLNLIINAESIQNSYLQTMILIFLFSYRYLKLTNTTILFVF